MVWTTTIRNLAKCSGRPSTLKILESNVGGSQHKWFDALPLVTLHLGALYGVTCSTPSIKDAMSLPPWGPTKFFF